MHVSFGLGYTVLWYQLKVDESPADIWIMTLWSSSGQRHLCSEEDQSILVKTSAGVSSTFQRTYKRTVYPTCFSHLRSPQFIRLVLTFLPYRPVPSPPTPKNATALSHATWVRPTREVVRSPNTPSPLPRPRQKIHWWCYADSEAA